MIIIYFKFYFGTYLIGCIVFSSCLNIFCIYNIKNIFNSYAYVSSVVYKGQNNFQNEAIFGTYIVCVGGGRAPLSEARCAAVRYVR